MTLKSSLSSSLSHCMLFSVYVKEKTRFHRHFRFLFTLDCLYIFHVAAAVIYLLYYFVQEYNFIARARAVLVLFVIFAYLYDHSPIFRCKMLIVLTKLLCFIFNCYFWDCHIMGTLNTFFNNHQNVSWK